jgi:hypothetical protein
MKGIFSTIIMPAGASKAEVNVKTTCDDIVENRNIRNPMALRSMLPMSNSRGKKAVPKAQPSIRFNMEARSTAGKRPSSVASFFETGAPLTECRLFRLAADGDFGKVLALGTADL